VLGSEQSRLRLKTMALTLERVVSEGVSWRYKCYKL